MDTPDTNARTRDAHEVDEHRVEYDADGTRLVGHAYVPADAAGPRPAVLVFPEWWGVTDFPRRRARELAAEGYVALAADMYGEGAVTDDVEEAGRRSADTRLGAVSRARSRAALQTLLALPQVDADRVAAIGFCFGGDVALELARDGAQLRGVVAFHASLTTGQPAAPDQLRASVLVLHGAEDPLTPPQQVAAFQDEMRASRADWQLVAYGNAVHSFTNPEADTAGIDGVAHDAVAARRAWQAHLAFLAEVLAPPAD
ncbi:hypothetical protein GCM10011354_30110 [Egicoccus halophilus]|uniref:Dienelactone hydrolase domain-containing protein n=1 Tax=Egicoccus halophilus TaxID=1670830 RepID=A0A8J3ACN4_9ACTN|nr:hypothetical protein GCM10011354_30110 [Egicoccus halophilus]